MADDSELLRAYVETRSEAAFAELVRRHLDLVYSAALRRVGGDTHLAQDVSQKVFAALARQARSLRGRAVLTGWLYTASRFAAAEVVRGERRRRAREQEVFVMNELFGNPAVSDPEWEKLRPVLDDAMDRLNERDREALLLRFFENRPLAEVGRELAVTEEGARKRVDRALEKLRGLLTKRGVASTSAAIALLLANQTVAAAPVAVAAAVATSAVSTAIASGSSWVAVFHLMNTSKIAIGIAGLTVVLSIGVGTYETLAGRRASEAEKEARRNVESLLATRQSLENAIRAAETDLARLRQTAEQARSEKVVAQIAVPTAADVAKSAYVWDPLVEGNAFIARHPELREALIAQKDAVVDTRFAELYQAMGWTEAQIAEFRPLMRMSRLSLSNDAGQPLLLQIVSDIPTSERTARLEALLGAEGLKKMRELSAREPARDLAGQIAGALGFTANPLTTEQAEALVQAIPVTVPPRGSGKVREVDWNGVMAKAGEVLSPSQLVALERLRRVHLSQQSTGQNPAPKSSGASSQGRMAP
jgi:RNA polymerase sigma factor (sigma-70 family)